MSRVESSGVGDNACSVEGGQKRFKFTSVIITVAAIVATASIAVSVVVVVVVVVVIVVIGRGWTRG